MAANAHIEAYTAECNKRLDVMRDEREETQRGVHTLEATLVTRTHERDDALRVSLESEQSMDVLQILMLDKERQHQDILITHHQTTEAMSSELNEVKAALSSARQSLERGNL